jgi:hypothetical protein
MHRLRNNFHGLGRLLAGWLLLWFVAMAAAPLALPTTPAAAHEANAGHAMHAAHDAHAGHAGHAGHEAHAVSVADPHENHAGHSAGSAAHCPLCLHAAAPPQAAPAQPLPGDAPSLQVAAMAAVVLRVRSDAPPPGRGPPAFS